jgi:predicted nucleic acid-binding protein
VLSGGPPGQLLERAFRGDYELVASEALLDEFKGVLIERFARPRDIARALRDEIEAIADLSRPERIARAACDPSDDFVLAAGLAGHADAIVSSDEDLLALGRYGEMDIIPPRHALTALVRSP